MLALATAQRRDFGVSVLQTLLLYLNPLRSEILDQFRRPSVVSLQLDCVDFAVRSELILDSSLVECFLVQHLTSTVEPFLGRSLAVRVGLRLLKG